MIKGEGLVPVIGLIAAAKEINTMEIIRVIITTIKITKVAPLLLQMPP